MQTLKSVVIKVDGREKNTGVVKHWEALAGNFPNLALEFIELEFGDYVIAEGFIVERKSATDFMLSVMDERIFGVLAKLKSEYDHIIYIVEGDIFAPRFHSNPEALRSALSYMTVIEHASLIPSADADNTAQQLYAMAVHAQHGPSKPRSLRGDKPMDLRTSQQYIVESLPGITADRALKLLNELGSVEGVLNASDEQLSVSGGLSAENIARIRKVLESSWKK